MSRDMIGALIAVLMLLTLAIGLALAGSSEPAQNANTQQNGAIANTTTDVPEEVESVRPTAESLYERLGADETNRSVFITQDGWIVVEIRSDAELGEDLQNDMFGVVLEYSDLINQTDHHPAPLVVRSGSVDMTVPHAPINQHASGNLTDEALRETVVVNVD